MIVSGNYYDNTYRTLVGTGYDGVARISTNNYYATGSLLYNGMAIVTAAHLFDDSNTVTHPIEIQLQTSTGVQTISATSVTLHPAYDKINGNNDLALVWLSSSAPISADRYAIYHKSDEIGHIATLVGYGKLGSGSTGDTTENTNNLRLTTTNKIEADISTLKNALGNIMAWQPTASSQFVADFDDGSNTHDALGQLIHRNDTGTGQAEGLIAPGDSGGPAFINGQLAGIASYTSSLSTNYAEPDIDSVNNSSFGEIAAWQRVSYYQQWIDDSIRSHFSNTPSTAQAVQKSVTEGDTGTSYAYFLLEFTGVRTNESELLSVDYTTKDGTALAGQDYIAQQGRLMLYPNETQVVIAVEVIGDYQVETDETFYLEVSNPVGGSFGAGVTSLIAMRTILNDDGLIA